MTNRNNKGKVAIMTIFQVPNFGSVLQAYATQIFFEELGYECEIINYKYPNSWHFKHGAIRPNRSFIRKILVWGSKKIGVTKNHRFQKKLKSFIRQFYHLTPEFKSLEELSENDWRNYDCVIAGSDQIWNPRFVLGDSAFMLSFVPDTVKKISLASSFATDHIPDILIDKYRFYLDRFSFLGVRENNGITILKNQLSLSSNTTVILDPTLLIPRSVWIEKMQLQSFKKRKPYILLYVLDYAFDPYPYVLEITNHFSRKMNLPIKVLSGKRSLIEKHIPVYQDCSSSSPREFLDLIRQADLVITSSFHGTAFAINFERPLIAVTPKNADDRQSNLLKSLDIETCKAEVGQSIESINPYYNYQNITNKLDEIRKQQYLFIETSIKN